MASCLICMLLLEIAYFNEGKVKTALFDKAGRNIVHIMRESTSINVNAVEQRGRT